MQLMVNRGRAKGQFIEIKTPRFLIGRDSACQLRPLSEEVSRRHAEIKFVSGIAILNDLGSETGTRLNGQGLTGMASLRNGDVIEIGPLSFTVLLDEPRRPRRTTEDEVASWLAVDDADADDEEPTAPPAPKPRHPVTAGSSVHRRSPQDRVGDEFELLKAMSARPE